MCDVWRGVSHCDLGQCSRTCNGAVVLATTTRLLALCCSLFNGVSSECLLARPLFSLQQCCFLQPPCQEDSWLLAPLLGHASCNAWGHAHQAAMMLSCQLQSPAQQSQHGALCHSSQQHHGLGRLGAWGQSEFRVVAKKLSCLLLPVGQADSLTASSMTTWASQQ